MSQMPGWEWQDVVGGFERGIGEGSLEVPLDPGEYDATFDDVTFGVADRGPYFRMTMSADVDSQPVTFSVYQNLASPESARIFASQLTRVMGTLPRPDASVPPEDYFRSIADMMKEQLVGKMVRIRVRESQSRDGLRTFKNVNLVRLVG